MKISLICRIKAKQHDKEIVLYAIEAPHLPSNEELNKYATWVEHAYENGFFNEDRGILVDNSYRDKFQMIGIYGVPKEYIEKYNIIVRAALQLSGLGGKELTKKEKALCLKYEPIAQISQMIDKWVMEELYNSKNIDSKLDN